MKKSVNLLIATASAVSAAIHNFYTGNFRGTSNLHSLAFDDVAVTLNLTRTLPAHDAHSWLSLSHDKKNLYGVYLTGNNVSSYSVVDHQTLRYAGDSTIRSATCRGMPVHLVQSSVAPYCVFASAMMGECGGAFEVTETGALSNTAKVIKFDRAAGIHGGALTPDQKFLYSADLSGNAIWGHRIIEGSCEVEFAFKLPVPAGASGPKGQGPRHLLVHPGGKWLYVLMEHSNTIWVYDISAGYENPVAKEVLDLLPPSGSSDGYWSAEINFSASKNYLWASTRGMAGTGKTGFINAYKLETGGGVSFAGNVIRQATTEKEGYMVQVQPAPWSDEWIAIVDHFSTENPKRGYAQIWRFNETARTLKDVAKVDINDGGCCGNVAWYD